MNTPVRLADRVEHPHYGPGTVCGFHASQGIGVLFDRFPTRAVVVERRTLHRVLVSRPVSREEAMLYMVVGRP